MEVRQFLFIATFIQFIIPTTAFIVLRVTCYVMAKAKGISWLKVFTGKELIAWGSVIVILIAEHVSILLNEYSLANYGKVVYTPFIYIALITIAPIFIFWIHWLYKYTKQAN